MAKAKPTPAAGARPKSTRVKEAAERAVQKAADAAIEATTAEKKKEAPKKEAPKKEAPKKEAPKKEAPNTAAVKKSTTARRKAADAMGPEKAKTARKPPAPRARPAPASKKTGASSAPGQKTRSISPSKFTSPNKSSFFSTPTDMTSIHGAGTKSGSSCGDGGGEKANSGNHSRIPSPSPAKQIFKGAAEVIKSGL